MTLPVPDPAFHWTGEPWGHALRCRPLGAHAQHLFTSRQLALPDAEAWRMALASVGSAPDALMRVRQVHSNVVRILKAGHVAADAAGLRPDGDAVVSNVPGHALAVMVADCVPILVCDPVRGAAAAIHAGWRGTCAGVAPAAVELMRREFDTDPAHLVCAIGPSAGPDDYEVGEQLLAAFREAGHGEASIERWFIQTSGKPRLDLWSANAEQLAGAGVPPRQIHISCLSTVSNTAVFDSYRVEGERAGRTAGLIVVPAPGGVG